MVFLGEFSVTTKGRKIALFLSLVAVVAFSALVAFLPTILSSEWGTNLLFEAFNKRISGKVFVKSAHFTWFSGQKLGSLSVLDQRDQEILSADTVQTEEPFWKILLCPENLKHLLVRNLQAEVIPYGAGVTNFHVALLNQAPGSESGPAIKLSDVFAEMTLPSRSSPLKIELQGKALQHDLGGEFSIQSNLQGADLTTLSKILTENEFLQESEGYVKVKISNLPVDALDHLFALQNPSGQGIVRALLGERLNLVVEKNFVQGAVSFVIDASSQGLDAKLLAHVQGKKISLLEPAHISLELEPKLLELLQKKIPSEWALSLEERSRVELSLTKLSIPIVDNALHLANASFLANLTLSRTLLHMDKEGRRVTIKGLKGTVSKVEAKEELLVKLDGEAQAKQQTSHLKLEAKLPFSNFNSSLGNLPLWSALSLESMHIPSAALEKFFSVPSELRQAFGSYVDLQLSSVATSGRVEATFTLSSDTIRLPNIQFAYDESGLFLQQPAVGMFIADSHGAPLRFENGLELETFSPIQFTVKELSFPGWKIGDPLFPKMQIAATLNAEQLTLSTKQDSIALQKVEAAILLPSLAKGQLLLTGELFFPMEHSFLQALVGKRGSFAVSSELTLAESGLISFHNLQGTAEGEGAHLSFAGEKVLDQPFMLTRPLLLNMNLTQERWNLLSTFKNHPFQLEKEALLALRIDRISFPMRAKSFQEVLLDAKLTADEISIVDQVTGEKASFAKLEADLKLNCPSQEAIFNLQSTISTPNAIDGTVALKASITDVHVFEGSLTCKGLPVFIAEGVAGQTNLKPLLGKDINILLKTFKDGAVKLSVEADAFKAETSLILAENRLVTHPEEPTKIIGTLTPEQARLLLAYAQKEKPNFVLSSPVEFEVDASKLEIPLSGSEGKLRKPDWNNLSLSLKGHMRGPTFTRTEAEKKLEFSKIEGTIDLFDAKQKVFFTLLGQPVEGALEKNQFALSGKMADLFDPKGGLDLQNMSISLEATTRKIPASFLGQYGQVDAYWLSRFKALFGENVDMIVSANLFKKEGDLDVAVKGELGAMTCKGVIRNGIFTLEQPLEAELSVTEALGATILQDIIPILSSANRSETSIYLHIAREGFSLPIAPFDLSQVKIKSAVVDLGKMHFHANGQLSQLLQLLKADALINPTVWFTPLYFSVKEGLIHTERVDFLINHSYPLALWGDIDMARGKIKMTLGLSAEALHLAFGISGLEKSYILQLPLKGPTGSAKIDKAKAMTKITALLAQTQGGPQGVIVGGVIDVLGGGSLQEKRAPAPTTSPLPWDQGDHAATDTQKTPNGPLEFSKSLLEKGAQKFLNLFNIKTAPKEG